MVTLPEITEKECVKKRHTRFQILFANFMLRMRRNDQNSTFCQIFYPQIETPIYSCIQFDYEFWAIYSKIYTRFERKTAFVMQNIRHFGTNEGGVTII